VIVAKKLPKRTVVIVGGGLCAGLISRQLTAKGIDVLVLERGGDHAGAAEATLPNQRDELRWDRRQGLMQNWQRETYTLRHSREEESLPIRWMEAFLPGEGVGGAASHWNGCAWRWSEYDPTLRSRYESHYGKAAIPADMPLQDWGTTYGELEPYHHLFEKLFGLSGKAGNIKGAIQPGGNPFEAPRRDEYPQKPLEMSEVDVVFKAAAEALGLRPFPQPAANSPGPYVNPDGQRLGQCQYCGHCERFICEAHAKATPDTLLYPMLRTRPRFEIRTHAHVLHIDYDRRAKRAMGVRYLDLDSGQEYEQPADIVVAAAFTMTNTRLLLLGGIGEPYDPATRRGVVGKNFCYQTMSAVNVFLKDRWINPFLGAGASGTVIDEFNNDNFDHSALPFLGGASFNAAVTNGRPIRTRLTPPGTPRWGTAWKKATADWYAHSFSVLAQGSCYPHRENFLDLDPDYSDAYGLPLLRTTFDFRENEVRMSDWVTRKLGEICKAMSPDVIGPAAGRSGPFDTRQYQTTHITGGTIMGADPRSSAVSPHLQHWDAENLFVVGASVYPHNSGYNPTGPLAALALRLGDDLLRYIDRPRML
jgi:gluconate 2-dehydrogenase alpha chain